MTSISSDLRMAMVCAGLPISHRNWLGAANQTCPVAVRGWVKVLRARIWVTSALHAWMLVWALSQLVTSGGLAPGVSSERVVSTLQSSAKVSRAKLERNGTIGLSIDVWRARMM